MVFGQFQYLSLFYFLTLADFKGNDQNYFSIVNQYFLVSSIKVQEILIHKQLSVQDDFKMFWYCFLSVLTFQLWTLLIMKASFGFFFINVNYALKNYANANIVQTVKIMTFFAMKCVKRRIDKYVLHIFIYHIIFLKN